MAFCEDTIELTITSSYGFIELVSSVTNTILSLISFDEETAQWVELSIRESVINAIKHGNKEDASKKVDVKYEIGRDEITVMVTDQGTGFDPSLLPDPLDPQNLLNPTGRGIFYMKTFMDEVQYSINPGGGTVVTMVKKKPATQA